MKYKLIIPRNVEIVATGFAMAGEKQIGKNIYRVEIWTTDAYPRFIKNDTRVDDYRTLPKVVLNMANRVIKLYNIAQQNIGY